MRCTTPRGHAERTKRLSLAICEGPDPAEHPPALGSQSPVPLAAPAQRLVCLAGKPTGSRRDGVSMMAGPSSTLYLTTLRRPARFSSAMPARGAHPHHRCVCTVHCVPRVALWQRPSTRDCGRPVSCARPGLAYGASSDHQPSGSGSRGGRATRHASTAVASAHVSARCGVAVAFSGIGHCLQVSAWRRAQRSWALGARRGRVWSQTRLSGGWEQQGTRLRRAIRLGSDAPCTRCHAVAPYRSAWLLAARGCIVCA